MTYATQQDLVDRYGEEELIQLTDRDAVAAIDADVVAKALSDADEVIDGYIGSRVSLPLASVPAVLVRVASDIARYFLHSDAPTEQVRTAYKDAIAWLKDVAAGRVSLGDNGTASAPAGETIEIIGDDRIFSRSRMRDF